MPKLTIDTFPDIFLARHILFFMQSRDRVNISILRYEIKLPAYIIKEMCYN